MAFSRILSSSYRSFKAAMPTKLKNKEEDEDEEDDLIVHHVDVE
jgi:hypothetical protein